MAPPKKVVEGIDRLLSLLSAGKPPAIVRLVSGSVNSTYRRFALQATKQAECHFLRGLAEGKGSHETVSWADIAYADDDINPDAALASLRHQLVNTYEHERGPLPGQPEPEPEPEPETKGDKEEPDSQIMWCRLAC